MKIPLKGAWSLMTCPECKKQPKSLLKFNDHYGFMCWHSLHVPGSGVGNTYQPTLKSATIFWNSLARSKNENAT